MNGHHVFSVAISARRQIDFSLVCRKCMPQAAAGRSSQPHNFAVLSLGQASAFQEHGLDALLVSNCSFACCIV